MGITVFLYGMKWNRRHHCINDVPSYSYNCHVDLFFYCNGQGSIMVPWGGIMVYTFLGGGSNEVLSYSCHIHMIAILACIYGEMSNVVSWSSTLCGAPKQSKLGIAVFIYDMICSKTHYCSNELPSYIYDFDFGLFLS